MPLCVKDTCSIRENWRMRSNVYPFETMDLWIMIILAGSHYAHKSYRVLYSGSWQSQSFASSEPVKCCFQIYLPIESQIAHFSILRGWLQRTKLTWYVLVTTDLTWKNKRLLTVSCLQLSALHILSTQLILNSRRFNYGLIQVDPHDTLKACRLVVINRICHD